MDPDRFVHLVFQIDANRINSRGGLDHMNRLEAWADAGVIMIHISEVAQREARAGRGAKAKKAISYIFSQTYADTEVEQNELRAIERALFPNGVRNENERNDVEIAFNAKKYGAILVTADGASRRQPGGILGQRAALARLGVAVVTDFEAVALVRQKIAERDELIRRRCERDRVPLPAWVGED
jgi:hypothetical protein